jgi:putative transposase
MYKLNRQLGIREKLGRKKKKKKRKIGIRASAPNQIWHTDITVVKTSDSKKHYVYLLIDNFSRKVLAFDIRDKVSGLVTSLLIQKAYERASVVSKKLNVKLICDGGPENNNIHVHNFINQSQINIQKLVALKDIDFSNSMVEAVNKTLKYHYLFPDHPENRDQLIKSLNYFVHDFNTIRPNGQLQGLTPDEAYQGMKMPDNFRTNILKQARIDRLAYNRENHCKLCK